uniref:C2H2-type domain-containing protein n=1 Tax=Romanomermis culicivorax TaxID=13658 RepID=A0A915HU86_ROMCU
KSTLHAYKKQRWYRSVVFPEKRLSSLFRPISAATQHSKAKRGSNKPQFDCLCFACFVRIPVGHMSAHSRMHMESESRHSFYCGQCYVILTKDNIRAHHNCFKKEASISGENVYTCPGCGFKSESPIKQDDHFRFCHRYDCKNCCDKVYPGLHNCDNSIKSNEKLSEKQIARRSCYQKDDQESFSSKLKHSKKNIYEDDKPAENGYQVDLLTLNEEEATPPIKCETTLSQSREIVVELPRDDDDVVNFRNINDKESENERDVTRKLNLPASLLIEIQRALSDDTNSSEGEDQAHGSANGRSVMKETSSRVPGLHSKKSPKSKNNNVRFACNICPMTTNYKSSVKGHIVKQHSIAVNRVDEHFVEISEDNQTPFSRNIDCQTDFIERESGQCCKECKIKDKNIKRLKTSIQTLLEMTGVKKTFRIITIVSLAIFLVEIFFAEVDDVGYGTMQFICQFCNRKFDDRKDHCLHLMREHKAYVFCAYCEKQFLWKTDASHHELKVHILRKYFY